MHHFTMPDEWAGRVVTCPFCSSQVITGGNQTYIPQPSPPPQCFGGNVSDPPQSTKAPWVWGILSLVLWIIPLFGFPVAITGIIVSGLRRHIGGIIMGIIGLIFSTLNAALGIMMFAMQNS
jgi:hypothetical protein